MLTGRIALRRGWFGRLVLTVEVREPGNVPGMWALRWRDATEADMAHLGVGTLKGN